MTVGSLSACSSSDGVRSSLPIDTEIILDDIEISDADGELTILLQKNGDIFAGIGFPEGVDKIGILTSSGQLVDEEGEMVFYLDANALRDSNNRTLATVEEDGSIGTLTGQEGHWNMDGDLMFGDRHVATVLPRDTPARRAASIILLSVMLPGDEDVGVIE